MSRKEIRAVEAELRRVLPSSATDREISELARAGVVVPIRSGWTFIHEGTSEDTCYIVLAGKVLVTRKGEKVVELGPGAVVGEMAFFGEKLRNASVRATTDAELLAIPFARLTDAVANQSGLRQALTRQVDAVTS